MLEPVLFVSITCCNYSAFLRVWSDLPILGQPVFLASLYYFTVELVGTLELSYQFTKAENQTRPHISELTNNIS